MNGSVVPYDPYHPHLGYTLFVTLLGWAAAAIYSRRHLAYYPRQRVLLYGVAMTLPLFGEIISYLVYDLRPAPETPIGFVLTHIHANYIQLIPIDVFLSPLVIGTALAALAGMALWSSARFLYSSYQLRHTLDMAVPLAATHHTLLEQLTTLGPPDQVLPEILVIDSRVPLAFTTGLFQARIYVATTLLESLQPDEIIAVLCHEWAHVLRRDLLLNWMMRVICDMTWFLPGTHVLWQPLITSEEEACDRMAAEMTRKPLALARALVKVCAAWQQASDPVPPLIAASSFAMTDGGPDNRVHQMLHMSDQRNLSQPPQVAYLLAGLLLLLSILPSLLGS